MILVVEGLSNKIRTGSFLPMSLESWLTSPLTSSREAALIVNRAQILPGS